MYKVILHPRIYKFLKRLPRERAVFIQRQLEKLATNPFKTALDIKRMKTTKRSWRLRIGKIRIVYEILKRKKIIWVAKIKFRGDIYK